MRIAIIAEVFLPKVDGVVSRTLNLIRQLRDSGDEIMVICPEVTENRSSPVPLIECPAFSCPSYPEYRIGMPDERMVERLLQFQPDVIHFLNPFAFGFQCIDLLRRRGIRIPSLFSFHTLYGEFVRGYRGLQPLSGMLWWLTRSYHNSADRNLTVSAAILEDLRQRGFQRLHLWPPAVDGQLFSPQHRSVEMRNRLTDNQPDRPLLLTVSRLAPEKNVAFLAPILDRLPDAMLAIVGGGPQQQELQQLFARRRVNFVGYLHGSDLAAAYASADAFIYASETETMGNVILEALASGLPVVAAAAGGVPGLMQHGVNGYLYPPGDAEAAAQFTGQLLSDREQRQAFSAAAVQSTRDQTWQRAAETVRQHYLQLAEQRETEEFTSERVPLTCRLCTAMLVRSFQTLAWMAGLRFPAYFSRQILHRWSVPDVQTCPADHDH